ncbi:MAG: hypothetical protein HYV48_04730, partial [Candidatus Omnitrophica bacterium]|nr:hypothetical protein [Candidatus Omnitrophota bacterium]
MKKLITILTLSLVIFSSQYTIAAEEQVLTGKEYFDVLHRVLSEAASTIDIQMYFMIANPEDTDDPVSVLIEDLIKAKDRGVMLRIILEDSKFSENYSAYKMLTLAGIKIDFDSPASLLHSKVIVIDGKIAVLGSANWSRAAFYDNHEASVIIRSGEICRQLLEDFSGIKLRQDVPALPYVIKGVNIRGDFLLSEKYGRDLVRDRARYAFDLYLLLLKKSQEAKSNVISADFTSLKNELGCRNIRRPRLRLDKTYNLIRYDAVRKEITILDFKEQSVPSGAGDFTLPFEYWEYGFDKSLSLRAKY